MSPPYESDNGNLYILRVNISKLCRPYSSRATIVYSQTIKRRIVILASDPYGGTVREAGCLGENHDRSVVVNFINNSMDRGDWSPPVRDQRPASRIALHCSRLQLKCIGAARGSALVTTNQPQLQLALQMIHWRQPLAPYPSTSGPCPMW